MSSPYPAGAENDPRAPWNDDGTYTDDEGVLRDEDGNEIVEYEPDYDAMAKERDL